jgi:hypothetical protein
MDMAEAVSGHAPWTNPLTNQRCVRTLSVEVELTTVFLNSQCTSLARPFYLASARRVATSVYGSMRESWVLRHSGGVLDTEDEAP